MVRVGFPTSATANIRLLVAAEAAPAWELFADLMREHAYYFREMAGGTYNCRNIGGTDKKSLHSYGIALDLNPSANPFRTQTHDFPQGFIDDVLETGLFRWGIQFDDPMHWEIDVPPEEITMPLSDEDIRRIWAFPSLAPGVHMQLAVTRTMNLAQAIWSFLTVDENTVDDDELDAAVDTLIEELPDVVLDRLRDRL